MEENKKMDIFEKKNKKRKQDLKDLRKVLNKKSKKNKDMSKRNNELKPIPNIKDIPHNCKHLVKAVLYVVPGDGCCGPNCAAALLFQDEIFGPELRRRMNLFMAKYWNTRYRYITQYSPGNHFVRFGLRGKNISHTYPQDLLDFLTNSKSCFYVER